MDKLIIATVKPWNIKNSLKMRAGYKDNYDISIISSKGELTLDNVERLNPKYIFFPHWSWIIPEEIFSRYECVVFHMTDLPFGRGGSPLQNLISRKVYNTKLSAIRVVKKLDAGGIYLKEDFKIDRGSAEELYKEASKIIFSKMIPYILKNDPPLREQTGDVTSFKRRRPEESNLLKTDFLSVGDIYDFVRMLDAEGYPRAFIDYGKYCITFKGAKYEEGKLTGRFEVVTKK